MSGRDTSIKDVVSGSGMRPVIAKALVVCLVVAVAPWLSGGQEPLGMLISGFALLLGSLLVWRQPQVPRLGRGPLVVAFGLLIGLAVLSLLWTANRYSSMLWIAQWVMAALAFRLAYVISASKVGRNWLVGAYLLSAGVFAAAAIWMYLMSEYGRLTGTFYWANPAAAYLIPAIILAIDGIRRSTGRTQYLWAVAVVTFGGSFLLTDSRAATAVLAFVILLYLLLVKLSKRFWILFVFSVALAFGASYGLVKLSSLSVQHTNKVVPGSRLNEAIKGESTSGSDRLYYLGSAFDMWVAHPLGGVGAGAYGDVHPQYQQRVISASTSAHNVYVQVLAELGLVGASLLSAVLLVLLVGLIRGLVARPELLPVALGLMGLLLHFGLDIDARYPALLGLVGILFGLIYTQGSAKWVAPSWKWPAVAALVLIPLASWYLSDTWAARGRSAQDDGDYALAAADFGRADQQFAFNPDVLSAEGINLYSLAASGAADGAANSSLALERARHAQQLDPHDGQHHQLEGRILALRGDLPAAELAFKQALRLDRFNHPDYALDLASILVREQKTDAAVSVASDMLKLYPLAVVNNRASDDTLRPTLANLEALIGNVHLAAGRIGEAGAAADRALALDPKSLRGRALKHQTDQLSSQNTAQ